MWKYPAEQAKSIPGTSHPASPPPLPQPARFGFAVVLSTSELFVLPIHNLIKPDRGWVFHILCLFLCYKSREKHPRVQKPNAEPQQPRKHPWAASHDTESSGLS